MENKILHKIMDEESYKVLLKLSYLRIIIVSIIFLISYYVSISGFKSYSNNIFYYISLISLLYVVYSISVTYLYKYKNIVINYFVPFFDFSFIFIIYLIANNIYQGYFISIFFLPTILLIVLISGLSFRNYYTYVFSSLSLILMVLMFSHDNLLFVESIFIWIPIFIIIILSLNISYRFYSIFNILKKRELLDRFFDDGLVERIEDNPELLNLSGENKHVVVFFLDIRGFTTISEGATPQEVFYLLNQFLGSFSEIISNNHGMVDKYIGDCIMAVFGIDSQRNYLQDTFNTVKQILNKLKQINEENIKIGKSTISIGIGIHLGNVIAGTVGHSHRMEYTVIGDTVNTASRIESLTRKTQDLVLFSKDFVLAYPSQKPFMYRGSYLLKGKTKEVDVYTLKKE